MRPGPRELLHEGHVVVLGQTRSGKTEWAKWHLTQPGAPRVQVFIDNKRDTHLPGFHVLDATGGGVFDARLLLKHPRVRILPPEDREGRKAFAASLSWKLRALGAKLKGTRASIAPWALGVWDETYLDAPPGDIAGGPVSNLAAQGVGLGVLLWSMAQHASTLSPTVFTQRRYLVLFHQEGGNYRKLRSNHGFEVPPGIREHVAKSHHFAVWDGRTWHPFNPLRLQVRHIAGQAPEQVLPESQEVRHVA